MTEIDQRARRARRRHRRRPRRPRAPPRAGRRPASSTQASAGRPAPPGRRAAPSAPHPSPRCRRGWRRPRGAPTSAGSDQSRRKCRPSTSRSVVATTRRVRRGDARRRRRRGRAAPRTTSSSRAVIAAIRATSPSSPTVASIAVTCRSCVACRCRSGTSCGVAASGRFASRHDATTRLYEKGSPMVVQAYILIQTEVGKAAAVAREIAEHQGRHARRGRHRALRRDRPRRGQERRRARQAGRREGAERRRHHPHPDLPGGPPLSHRSGARALAARAPRSCWSAPWLAGCSGGSPGPLTVTRRARPGRSRRSAARCTTRCRGARRPTARRPSLPVRAHRGLGRSRSRAALRGRRPAGAAPDVGDRSRSTTSDGSSHETKRRLRLHDGTAASRSSRCAFPSRCRASRPPPRWSTWPSRARLGAAGG